MTALEGLGIQSVARDLETSCRLNLHMDASATMCLANRRGLGKAKHVDMQNLWIQDASKSGWFATKKVDTSVNLADLMTKPIPKATAHEPHGIRVRERRDKRVDGPGDNDTGVLSSGGNSRTTGIVCGTLATRRILTSALRRPRWRGEIGDFWQCRAGNALTGTRIRGR